MKSNSSVYNFTKIRESFFLPKSVLLLFSWHCPFNLSSYFSRDIVPLNRILLLLEAKAWVVTQLYARPLKLFMGVIKLRKLIRPYIRIYNLIYFSRFFHTALQNKAVFKWHMQRFFFTNFVSKTVINIQYCKQYPQNWKNAVRKKCKVLS